MSDFTPVSATTVINVLSDVVDAVGGHPGNVTLLGFHAVDVGKILHVTMPSGEAMPRQPSSRRLVSTSAHPMPSAPRRSPS